MSQAPCMWDVVPDDVKCIIASYLNSRAILTALSARPTRAAIPLFPASSPLRCPTRAPIPVFPASSPLRYTDDKSGTVLVEISQHFKSCNILSFHGNATLDVLFTLSTSPATRFESIALTVFDVSRETLHHFCSILGRANRIKLIFKGSARVTMCEAMLDFIGPGCTSLKIKNMPASESFLKNLSWTLRRVDTLCLLDVVPGSSFCRFSPGQLSLDVIRKKMKDMTDDMVIHRTVHQMPLCRVTFNGKGPHDYVGPALSQINRRLYGSGIVCSDDEILSTEHYDALKSLGFEVKDLVRCTRRLFLNRAYTTQYAMDLLRAIQDTPKDGTFTFIGESTALTRILEALPDKMDDMLVCVYDARLLFGKHEFNIMKSAHLSIFDAFVDRVIFFLPYLIASDAEKYMSMIKSISSPRLYDATVAHLARVMERVKENFKDHVYTYIWMTGVLSTLRSGCVIRIKADMSPAFIEGLKQWISDMVYASVEFASADRPPTWPVELLDEAQEDIVSFSTLLLPSGESYKLKKQFPPQWKHVDPSNPKKRKTMKGAIAEEISKRQKRA